MGKQTRKRSSEWKAKEKGAARWSCLAPAGGTNTTVGTWCTIPQKQEVCRRISTYSAEAVGLLRQRETGTPGPSGAGAYRLFLSFKKHINQQKNYDRPTDAMTTDVVITHTNVEEGES